MSCVFIEEINGWDSWGKVFQSIPAFEKLIIKIFEKENLPCKGISNLTPGSNAVFKVGDYVIKIFAPIQAGVDTEIDYKCEILGMKRAMDIGINIPPVISTSFIVDKYRFSYIIMGYIEGKDAKDILKCYSAEEKVDFVRQLKRNLNKMNGLINESYPSVDVRERVLSNPRWNILPDSAVNQIKELVKDYDMPNKVYVHGDITGENVMIDKGGMLYIIDFADGRLAPREYEFPPILFDLFDFDKLMIDEFIKDENIDEFIEKCFYGILIHEFGVYFVKLICERILGIEIRELTDIFMIKEVLFSLFTK